MDETMIQISANGAWLLWIAIEPIRNTVLGVYLLRKSSLKELYSNSRIRLNVLMIAIFHAGKSYVTSHMYTNG
jgi:hypothetical protein